MLKLAVGERRASTDQLTASHSQRIYLTVRDGRNGEVPRGVGGHEEAEEGPDPVVVEGGDEHGGGAAGAEDVRPGSFVVLVVDVVDVAARSSTDRSVHTQYRSQSN